MTELDCSQARDLVTEYALGILEPAPARQMSDHISRCITCRRDVDQTGALGDRLLDLVPDAEPPLGFDRSAIAAIERHSAGRRHPGVFAGFAAAAAAIAAVVGLFVANLTNPHQPARPSELAGTLREGNLTVGSVYIAGHPAWITMSVDHAALTGMVTCQLVARDGSTTTVGDFQLVDGSGKWSAPDPETSAAPVGARLIGPDGAVMATASLSPAT